MSATNTLTMLAAVLLTAIIYTIMDPIITDIEGNVTCTVADCTTGLSYFTQFWDYILWMFLILIVMWYLVNSIREQGYGGMFR